MAFKNNMSTGRVVIRLGVFLVPKELPSGYLKHSASPKSGDICYVGQLFNTQKTVDINEIGPQRSGAGVKAFSASTPN